MAIKISGKHNNSSQKIYSTKARKEKCNGVTVIVSVFGY